MPKQKSPQELSVDELRWLLVEKRRVARQSRLERYRRSGRVVLLASDLDNPSLESWRTEEVAEEPEPSKAPKVVKRILDGILLLIELSAFIGFIYIVYSGLNVLRELNQEVVSAIEQPTLTPTPLIAAVVLPSGHTPPNSPGGARFNEAEIPEHLRPLVQSLFNAPLPTPGPSQAIRIQIPALHVDAPIVQGDGWEQLEKASGSTWAPATPASAPTWCSRRTMIFLARSSATWSG